MTQEQNRPYFPFAEFLILWLFGMNDNEMVKEWLKSLSADEIDTIIDEAKNSPLEEEQKEFIIKELSKYKQDKD